MVQLTGFIKWRLRIMPKQSENAKAVAREVLRRVSKGEPVVMKEIIRKSGHYSPSIATHPHKVTQTQSYQEELKPFTDRLIAHRNRILKTLEKKNLGYVQYNHLSDSLAKSIHDIQLLTGGATENIYLKEVEQLRNSVQDLIVNARDNSKRT